MPTRRLFLATFLATAAFAAGPAGAQGKGNGASNGQGNGGNGKGGRGGDGNGGGNAGRGNGGKGNGGNGNSAGKKIGTGLVPAPAEERTNAPSSLRLRHSNGFEEEIGAGRYEMRDDRGRRIVNRAAQSSDYQRLRRLSGR